METAVASELTNVLKFGLIDSIRSFLSQVNNINVFNSDGNTLLHEAVIMNNEDVVKLLVSAGVDVNFKNSKGDTALGLYVARHCDNFSKDYPIFHLLVDAGACANTKIIKDKFYVTALHLVAERGHVVLVQSLISRGADVKARDDRNNTPLHYASRNVCSEDPFIFEILLSAGADVKAKNSFGQTPLHLLASCKSKLASLPLCDIVKVFSKYGADFNAAANDGSTPMDCSIDSLNYEAVKALVMCTGTSVNSKFKSHIGNHVSILHEACAKIDLATVEFFLRNGVNINALDRHNKSLLNCAIISLHAEQVTRTHEVARRKKLAEKLKLLRYLLEWNPNLNSITIHQSDIPSFQAFDLTDPLFMNGEVWETLIQHVSKLFETKHSICPNILNSIINNPTSNKYFIKCKKELKSARKIKLLSNNPVTFFNLLTDDETKLIKYAADGCLEKNFTGSNEIKKFPIFGIWIQERVMRTVKNIVCA